MEAMSSIGKLAAAVGVADPNAAASKEKAAAGESTDWTFPVFLGCRRRLPPDNILFEAGNIEREQLARQTAVTVARDERRQLSREADLAHDAELADHLRITFECRRCHAALPTERLLEIHVVEMHDSLFAAQAARRMPVYLCLVEGCPRKFCTVEERKQHLTDHHKFPRHFHFDRLHLRRRRAQIRPLPQFRKTHERQAMAASNVAGVPAEAAASAAAGGPAAAGEAAPPVGKQLQQQQQQEEEHRGGTASHEEVLHGMFRLSMAAESSTVPNVIHFGRGRGRGLAGRGRGRCGGQKAPAGAAAPDAPVPAATAPGYDK